MSRKATIAQAVKAHPKVASGGTSAPKSAGPKKQGFGIAGNQATNGGAIAAAQPAKAQSAAPAAAAPSPYSAPLPWDSAYEQSVNTANTKYNNSLASLRYLQTATDQDYGLSAGYNDYQSNPYSRAALLEGSFKKANKGTINSYAAGGQLYAGSTSNALSGNRANYAQNHDALEKAYREAIQKINTERTGAGDERNEALANATWNRVENAAGEDLDPTTAPEAGGGGSGGSSAGGMPKKKKASAKPKTAVSQAKPAAGGKKKKK